ncbi:hypothetical protein Pelo_6351 [Pelomyxa schiedti]|nr:hypothetical protein Pelo_6351 [Pelomyxa schiedti]
MCTTILGLTMSLFLGQRLCPEPETEPEESRDYTQLDKVKISSLETTEPIHEHEYLPCSVQKTF